MTDSPAHKQHAPKRQPVSSVLWMKSPAAGSGGCCAEATPRRSRGPPRRRGRDRTWRLQTLDARHAGKSWWMIACKEWGQEGLEGQFIVVWKRGRVGSFLLDSLVESRAIRCCRMRLSMQVIEKNRLRRRKHTMDWMQSWMEHFIQEVAVVRFRISGAQSSPEKRQSAGGIESEEK